MLGVNEQNVGSTHFCTPLSCILPLLGRHMSPSSKYPFPVLGATPRVPLQCNRFHAVTPSICAHLWPQKGLKMEKEAQPCISHMEVMFESVTIFVNAVSQSRSFVWRNRLGDCHSAGKYYGDFWRGDGQMFQGGGSVSLHRLVLRRLECQGSFN